MIFAPRSWPSSPGFATRMRTLRAVSVIEGKITDARLVRKLPDSLDSRADDCLTCSHGRQGAADLEARLNGLHEGAGVPRAQGWRKRRAAQHPQGAALGGGAAPARLAGGRRGRAGRAQAPRRGRRPAGRKAPPLARRGRRARPQADRGDRQEGHARLRRGGAEGAGRVTVAFYFSRSAISCGIVSVSGSCKRTKRRPATYASAASASGG